MTVVEGPKTRGDEDMASTDLDFQRFPMSMDSARGLGLDGRKGPGEPIQFASPSFEKSR